MAATARRPAPTAAKCAVGPCPEPQAGICSWVHHERTADGFESEGKPCRLGFCEHHLKRTKAGIVCPWHYGVAERKHKEAAAKAVD